MQSSIFGTRVMMGTFVFNGIVGTAFLVSCSACLLTADAISAERREGTLGLLFLTRVRVMDVLVGKLGSIGLVALCGLLAFIPILMLPVLIGGVTGGEATRKGLGLLDCLFLALSVGLLSSAAESERFRAVRAAVALLGGIIVLPFLSYVGWGHGIYFYAGLLSPLVLLIRAGDMHYRTSPILYWVSLFAIQVVTWALLVYAGWRLRREVTRAGCDRNPRPRENDRAIGLDVWQPLKTQAPPVEWLVYREYGVPGGLWAVAVLALACNAWVPLVRQAQGIPAGPFFLAVASPLGTVSGLIGAGVMAWVASRFFVGVRNSGDLEMLLTTPVGAQTVLTDQWRVLKRLFVWPVLFMQAPMLPQFLIGISALHADSAAALSPSLVLLKLLTVANSFLGTSAVCWLGLWFGLRARSQAGAIIWTVGLGKGLTSLFELICSIAYPPSSSAPGAIRSQALIGWWIPELVSSLFYIGLVLVARRGLLRGITGKNSITLGRPIKA
jgi:hypothetical protein